MSDIEYKSMVEACRRFGNFHPDENGNCGKFIANASKRFKLPTIAIDLAHFVDLQQSEIQRLGADNYELCKLLNMDGDALSFECQANNKPKKYSELRARLTQDLSDEIDRRRAELERLKAERDWIPVSERLPEPDVQVLIDQGEDISSRYDVDYVDVCPEYGHEFFANYDDGVVRWKYIEPPKDK